MIAVSIVKVKFESVLQCLPLSKVFISYLQIAAPLGAHRYFVKLNISAKMWLSFRSFEVHNLHIEWSCNFCHPKDYSICRWIRK